MKTVPFLFTLVSGLALAWLAGCSGKTDVAPSSGAASAPALAASAAAPPVTVSTVKAQQRDLPVLFKANGTVSALTSVDIRPQVSSVVAKVHFREGQFVKAGELLAQKKYGQMVSFREFAFTGVSIARAVGQLRRVSPASQEVRAALAVGASFGNSRITG